MFRWKAMSEQFQKEAVKSILKDKLNADKIKLWLPPYTDEATKAGTIPEELVKKYSSETGYTPVLVAELLEELRLHALERLAARNKFQREGVATLRVKVADSQNASGQKLQSVEISVEKTGRDLKEEVSRISGVDRDRLKLVCAGRLIEDSQRLQSQGIKNNSLVLALCLGASEAEARKQQEQSSRLQTAREAAELLASRNDEDEAGYYIQIADQSGKPLQLPKEERKALVLAMTLHEKGKATLKRKDYAEALLLLLEADKEFKKCRADILNAVDNYALVCLDVVWCYLCLKNVSELPDAEVRLKACEDCFKKSYGPNLERLALVKGGTGTEKALYMRLHLLQAIVSFHQDKKQEAQQLLHRAETELKELTVDEESMEQVMAMGFTQQEARLGLRMCLGNVQLAVAHIMKRREEKKELKEKERAEKEKKRLEKSLGNTADGSKVNVEHYGNLVDMGFPKGAAQEALRQTNNDLMQALQVLQDHPELLDLPDPPTHSFLITDDMMEQISGLGYNEHQARTALAYFRSVDKAIEGLISSTGEIQPAWLEALDKLKSRGENDSANLAGTSRDERRRERALMDTIIPDIATEEEDHLDLTLDEERQFLEEYKAYIESSKS